MDKISPCLGKPQIVSYSEVPIFINNKLILANSLSLSNDRNITPNFIWDQRNPNRLYIPEPPSLTFSINYYPTLQDIIYELINSQKKAELKIMNNIFKNCYITSFSMKGSVNSLIECSANITCWSFEEGSNFTPYNINLNNNWVSAKDFLINAPKPDINIAHSNFSIYEQYYVYDRLPIMYLPSSFSFSVNSKYYERIKIGNKFPESFIGAELQKQVDLEGSLVNKIISLDFGQKGRFSITLKDVCDNFMSQFFEEGAYTKDVSLNDTLYFIEGYLQSLEGNVAPKANYNSSVTIKSWE